MRLGYDGARRRGVTCGRCRCMRRPRALRVPCLCSRIVRERCRLWAIGLAIMANGFLEVPPAGGASYFLACGLAWPNIVDTANMSCVCPYAVLANRWRRLWALQPSGSSFVMCLPI